MQKHNTDLSREKAIHRYIQALDLGDMEGVAAVLEAALDDPELERIITEINLAYQEEEQLTPIVNDAQLIRDLIRKHLHSAFENYEEKKPLTIRDVVPEEEEKPLTVGDVAKCLQESNRVPSADRDTLRSLLGSSVPLPTSPSIRAVRQLAAQLRIKASERFLDIFRDTAIMLSMGRSHSKAQLAAAREQRGRYQTRQNKTKKPFQPNKKLTEGEKD